MTDISHPDTTYASHTRSGPLFDAKDILAGILAAAIIWGPLFMGAFTRS